MNKLSPEVKLSRAYARLEERQRIYDALPTDADPQTVETARQGVLSLRGYVKKVGGDPGPLSVRPPTVKRETWKRRTRPAETLLPPPEQVRRSLEKARRRGTPFRVAFRHALRTADYPSDGQKMWRDALKDTRDEWEAAYLGEPPVVPGMAVVLSALQLAS